MNDVNSDSYPTPQAPCGPCDLGNCLCGGAVLEKVGMDLPLLDELLPFAAILSTDVRVTADYRGAAGVVRATIDFDGGTSIGRALRLRIESLLI